jgi:hypothetical protein
MGLDSYLYKESFIRNWDHTKPEDTHLVVVSKGGVIREDVKPERVSAVREQVGYWRKFSALHGWFVNKCGGGVDECQSIPVSVEDLKELLETLNNVKTILGDFQLEFNQTMEKIKELFPPTPGFFFGSTDIDEYFIQKVNETIPVIEGIIKEDAENRENRNFPYYYYRASW